MLIFVIVDTEIYLNFTGDLNQIIKYNIWIHYYWFLWMNSAKNFINVQNNYY